LGRLEAEEEATRNGSSARETRRRLPKGLLSEAIESLLSGEVTLGKELSRDYINATVGFPKLAAHTKIHVKTLHQMFGPNGNPTASNLFERLVKGPSGARDGSIVRL
jgi:hypothetical protein